MLSIVIPVYNEEKILEASSLKVHDYLESRHCQHEIIVVSNGSRDRTVEICAKLEKTYPWFRSFSLEKRGVGAAFAEGVRQARGEYIISVDIDLPIELAFIDYAEKLLEFCDILIGSKIMGSQDRSFIRIAASEFYIFITQICFGLTFSDYSIGAKGYRRSAILDALPFITDWTGYVFEICLHVKNRGGKILQIGIECVDRRRSRFSLVHEGLYRYTHLFKCFRAWRNRESWLYRG